MNLIKDYSFDLRGIDKYVDLVIEKQIRNRSFWEHFTDVFGTNIDDDMIAWRGEFFGKMMRGASLIYMYRRDEEVYDILTEAAKRLLTKQDGLGRISTYSVEKEFQGWDVWCRKYVMVGLLHYYAICKDENFKAIIVDALRKHLDYIISKIGPGKIDICTTTNFWEGVNSSSILEPVMNFYNITKEPRYLEFARYIVERGGTLSQNLVELAYENKLKPYQYNVTKAYEMMSFFEGVFEYYKVTKEEKLLKAVTNFIDAVAETDLTLIGSCGCTHELFDNSTKTQTVETEVIKQETCVTVTWIRLNTKLLMYTDDVKYFEHIESSFYNGLLGALNTENEEQYAQFEHKFFYPSIFDSYSPLCNAHRGLGIGGFQYFADGTYYGCCIAIGAAGIALMPLTAVMKKDDSIVINNYIAGTIYGGAVTVSDGYLTHGRVSLFINKAGKYSFLLRNPKWSDKSYVSVNGEKSEMKEGYNKVEGNFEAGTMIDLSFDQKLTPVYINDSIAFVYPPSVLAFDQYKQNECSPRDLSFGSDYKATRVGPKNEETIRFDIDGKIFSNYESCGKHYSSQYNLMSVWFKTK